MHDQNILAAKSNSRTSYYTSEIVPRVDRCLVLADKIMVPSAASAKQTAFGASSLLSASFSLPLFCSAEPYHCGVTCQGVVT